MNGDRMVRRMTAAAVLVVAAIAAVVSFIHIQRLAITHGQTPLAAWLLPVSVDGTVAAASMSMLWAARSGLSTPWLARAMLGLGVAATLAANVGYGAPYGLAGEMLSGWPAVAFIGSAELAISMVRRARPSPVARDRAAVTARPVATRRPRRRPAAKRPADTEAAALTALSANPAMSARELATAIGVSDRTARRVRARLAAPEAAT